MTIPTYYDISLDDNSIDIEYDYYYLLYSPLILRYSKIELIVDLWSFTKHNNMFEYMMRDMEDYTDQDYLHYK